MTTATLPEETRWLANLDERDAIELACRAHLGVWSARKRGMLHAPLHWEWSELAMFMQRLALVAPREHAKSETFTVNQIVWRCTYTPGIRCRVFTETGDMGLKIKERIDNAMLETAPWMMERMQSQNTTESTYANFSGVDVAGAGKGVRGDHPDVIVGDDVLSEGTALTSYQRAKIARWWKGTISGMAHPGTTRALGKSQTYVTMPPTRVHLIGTPFHQQDLLMGMRENALYHFRRYAAEFDPGQLVAGTLAVEVN